MKKSKIMTATLLIAAVYTGIASAHTQSGTVGLATSGAAKTDVYVVTCNAPGTKLYLRVRDLAPVKAPLISIQATKGASSSALSTDAVDGDANYSAAVTLAAGSGNYVLKVNKSASSVIGIESYVAEFHCQNAGGGHTTTTWDLTQNQ